MRNSENGHRFYLWETNIYSSLFKCWHDFLLSVLFLFIHHIIITILINDKPASLIKVYCIVLSVLFILISQTKTSPIEVLSNFISKSQCKFFQANQNYISDNDTFLFCFCFPPFSMGNNSEKSSVPLFYQIKD